MKRTILAVALTALALTAIPSGAQVADPCAVTPSQKDEIRAIVERARLKQNPARDLAQQQLIESYTPRPRK